MDRALSDREWWRLVRHAERVSGDGPLTGLPLAEVHPSVSELIRVRDLAALWLMGHAGLRVGEVVRLPWMEVYRGGLLVSRIVLGSGVAKGGRERVIPMDPYVGAALARLHVVATARGVALEGKRVLGVGRLWRRLGTRIVQRKVADLGRGALGRAVGCHALRHTFAVRIRRRADVAVCQRLLGHARLSSTEVYLGVTAEECDQAVAGLSA